MPEPNTTPEIPPIIWSWLDTLDRHLAPPEMRSPLREYQALAEKDKVLSPALLMELYTYPWRKSRSECNQPSHDYKRISVKPSRPPSKPRSPKAKSASGVKRQVISS